MKTIPVCLIFATSLGLCCPMATAQPGPADRMGEEGKTPEPHGLDHWKKADEDGNGTISREEFDRMPRTQRLPEEKRAAVFSRLDKDQDGGISREEIRKIFQGQDGERPQKPRIRELDTNQDGGVSFEEFQQGAMIQKLDAERQQKMFQRLDTNGDGKISAEDKPALRPHHGEESPVGPGGRPERPGMGAMLERLDQDHNGSLSFEEFRNNPRVRDLDDETARRRFQMLDRNGDGQLDKQDRVPADGGQAPNTSTPVVE